VCDISAVAVDWLPTGKPLVVTRPAQPLAPILSGGMLSQLPLLGSDEAGGVLAALVRAGEQESLDQLRSWADYYFAPGDVATFVDAVLDLVPVDAARTPPE
jgi:hypothetical protein